MLGTTAFSTQHIPFCYVLLFLPLQWVSYCVPITNITLNTAITVDVIEIPVEVAVFVATAAVFAALIASICSGVALGGIGVAVTQPTNSIPITSMRKKRMTAHFLNIETSIR
jgi:hypothetical protein